MRLNEIQTNEGLHDPYIFKAVFMAGMPGSGKSTVRNLLFAGSGLKLVDADEVRRAYIEMKRGGDYDVYGQIVRRQRETYMRGRLGIILDTTAWWLPSVYETTKQLTALGYDVGMVYVDATIEMAISRAERRAEQTGRVVPEDEIKKRYDALKKNLHDYKDLFGESFWMVDNTGSQPDVAPVKRSIRRWLMSPPSSPIAKKWQDDQMSARQAQTRAPDVTPDLRAS
jgi:predicted ABC-type ATPase